MPLIGKIERGERACDHEECLSFVRFSLTGRSGASQDGRVDHGHAEGGCMHMRVPHTKADMTLLVNPSRNQS